jgi:hypothetical protein
VRILVVALVVASALVACSSGSGVTPLTFYRPSTVLTSGKPGDVLSREPIELAPSLPGTGWRIRYVSTTPRGDLVPISGVLIQPLVPPPPGGYPVVVWAHGTTGLGDQCAPSAFAPFNIPAAGALLAAGDVVVAPDYEGLGIPDEIHPYLVGQAEGNNVLDAARAARTMGGGNVVDAWGWSQGGHAALFARELQPKYAPELDFRGAVAQAPVTNVGTFLGPGRTDPKVFPYTAEAILAWAEVYEETALTDLVNVADAEKARLAQQSCTGDIIDHTTKPLDEIFRSDPNNTQVWKQALAANSVVAGSTRAPVMLTHGDADVTVPIAGTAALHDDLCKRGVHVQFLRDPTWDHGTAYYFALDAVTNWIRDRIAVTPAPEDC